MFHNSSSAVQLSDNAESLIRGLNEIASDEITPIAFSRARVFRQPQYMVYAEIRYSRQTGDYVYFAIVKLDGKQYDLDSPVYESASIEDIADVWQIFR